MIKINSYYHLNFKVCIDNLVHSSRYTCSRICVENKYLKILLIGRLRLGTTYLPLFYFPFLSTQCKDYILFPIYFSYDHTYI